MAETLLPPACSFTNCVSDVVKGTICVPPIESGVPSAYVAIPVVSVVFLFVAISGCVMCCLPLGRWFDQRLVGMLVVMTAVCMWVFWLINFLSQLNPIRAPILETTVAGHIRKVWAQSASNPPLCQTW